MNTSYLLLRNFTLDCFKHSCTNIKHTYLITSINSNLNPMMIVG